MEKERTSLVVQWLRPYASTARVLSHVWLFMTPWTVARQAPLSMVFSRQEYWSELPLSSSGDLPDSGIESGSPELQVNSLPSEAPGKPNKSIPLFKHQASLWKDNTNNKQTEANYVLNINLWNSIS